MRGHGDDIDAAVADLVRSVADGVAPLGWRRRDLGGYALATFTRDFTGGVFLGLELTRRSFSWPADWPVEVTVRLGVGYGPALDLMPLLTLDPDVVLVPAAPQAAGSGLPVSLTGPRSVAAASRDVLAYIQDQEKPLTEQFPDVDSLERALDRSGDTRDVADREGARDRYSRRRHLTLLTAMGRTDDAREGLAAYLLAQPDADSSVDGRFPRQLGRWLDRGAPVAPPLEETLAQLPPRPQMPHRPRPTLTEARDRAQQRREAVDTVRKQASGRTPEQLRALLVAEYDRRGVTASESGIATAVAAIQAGLRPFGRARLAIDGIRLLTSWGSDMVQLVKTGPPVVPAWRQPPERATFIVRTWSPKRTAVVGLDPDIDSWLTQVWPPTREPLGQREQVDVWLSYADTSTPEAVSIVAHIGDRRVGTLNTQDATALHKIISAAEIFDEQPCLRGQLTRADHMSVILEIPIPDTPESSNPATA